MFFQQVMERSREVSDKVADPTCQTQVSSALPAAPMQPELVGLTSAGSAWREGTPD